jgi:hypothetical protein
MLTFRAGARSSSVAFSGATDHRNEIAVRFQVWEQVVEEAVGA